MNAIAAQPQPLKGLLAILFAIPFVRAAFNAIRRTPERPTPIVRKPAPTPERDNGVMDEKTFHALLAPLAEEIARLLDILEAHRNAHPIHAQIAARTRALATAKTNAPRPSRRSHRHAPTADTRNPPTLQPDTPKPQAKDRGSG